MKTVRICNYETLNLEAEPLYICKYLSPNLFLHMNNAHYLNLESRYSMLFRNDVIASQLSHMVPFP